jgi:hypothetical protein
MPTKERETPPPTPNPPAIERAVPFIQPAPPPIRQTSTEQPTWAGSCTLRLENLEAQTSKTKRELMHSIAQDICATFTCIAKHAEAGNLEDQHTDVIDNVIKIIRDTDVKSRHRLDKRWRRLRKERDWLRIKHRKMGREIDEFSLLYRKKVGDLTVALRERNHEVEQLRAERELLLAKIHEDSVLARGAVDNETDVDGEFEIDTEKV